VSKPGWLQPAEVTARGAAAGAGINAVGPRRLCRPPGIRWRHRPAWPQSWRGDVAEDPPRQCVTHPSGDGRRRSGKTLSRRCRCGGGWQGHVERRGGGGGAMEAWRGATRHGRVVSVAAGAHGQRPLCSGPAAAPPLREGEGERERGREEGKAVAPCQGRTGGGGGGDAKRREGQIFTATVKKRERPQRERWLRWTNRRRRS
jgi:hypothetical protein